MILFFILLAGIIFLFVRHLKQKRSEKDNVLTRKDIRKLYRYGVKPWYSWKPEKYSGRRRFTKVPRYHKA